ncbi:hypothetical protein [Thermococcus sp.]
MEMFDYIHIPAECPVCGHKLKTFQTMTNKYNVIAVKRSWIVEVLEKIGKKVTLTLYEGTIDD